jgi:hypothetical protein
MEDFPDPQVMLSCDILQGFIQLDSLVKVPISLPADRVSRQGRDVSRPAAGLCECRSIACTRE